MEESLKIDEEYKRAFNLGYDLAKELNLTSPMFREANQNSIYSTAMQAGMAEFCSEIAGEKQTELGLGRNKSVKPKSDKDKGFNISI
ncbi:hypothetical protein [Allomuricauda sp. ARW1Y1]|jgi:hypothetical protein|uniref:hypothetical protein n=1 Tax=Allomuricauda sp. ARW1Y1 TaxID=2663843 RepID=UPI0015CBD01E|nr:hypothetical protein [Muricauda sp. ARW1Y1]NYJ28126.1 hypothetical protein [Muricauda sp. ARW1Y1]